MGGFCRTGQMGLCGTVTDIIAYIIISIGGSDEKSSGMVGLSAGSCRLW